jgi:hypothetical protein
MAITEHNRLKDRPPACPKCGKGKTQQRFELQLQGPEQVLSASPLSERPRRPEEAVGRLGQVAVNLPYTTLPPLAASLGLGVFLRCSSQRDFTTRALDR